MKPVFAFASREIQPRAQRELAGELEPGRSGDAADRITRRVLRENTWLRFAGRDHIDGRRLGPGCVGRPR